MRQPRRRIDMPRLGQALAAPGMDTRTWTILGRVDDDPDAIVWDSDLGWLADVTLSDGEGPICCRVGSSSQGNGVGRYCPVRPGGLVGVIIASGDPNESPFIVCQFHDIDDFKAPTEVNGSTIVETNASSGQVAADETHFAVHPLEDLDEEWRKVRLTADEMVLGAADADQEMVRGGDQADALDDLADALSQVIAALAVAPVAGAVVALDPATLSTFQAAVQAFKSARTSYLSSRITID